MIRNEDNLGFARANNLGIRRSVGRYICLVNSDVTVLPGCLDALADYLDRNPTVGNVGPRVFNADMTLQSSCRRFPTLWNNLCSATGLAAAFKGARWFSGEHMLYFDHDRIASVDVLVGCFWMLRRDALRDVGLLDEEFFMYGEDVDWCRRCWTAGWKVFFVPDAHAIHYRGASSCARPVLAAVMQQRSVLYYWSKHHCSLALLAIKGVFLGHHFIRCLVGLAVRYIGISKSARNAGRLQVSQACLRALLLGDSSQDESGRVGLLS